MERNISLLTAYENLINPNELTTHFKSFDGFKSWGECGSIEDLKCTLVAFEIEQLYEYCAVIRDTIIEKYKTAV